MTYTFKTEDEFEALLVTNRLKMYNALFNVNQLGKKIEQLEESESLNSDNVKELIADCLQNIYHIYE
jgi:hypothetical protein